MRILVHGGTVVSDGRSFDGDILVAGETIAALGEKIATPAGVDRVVDAAGCQVFPGGIDPHVHMELQTPSGTSGDDFASGSRAALAGGTTTIIDFVTPRRQESLTAALAARRDAAQAAACDYLLHMSVTAWDERTFSELAACCQQGVRSVKAYLAYPETIGIDDAAFLSLLDAARRLKFLTLVHAESGDMVAYLQRKLLAAGGSSPAQHPLSRPPEVEADAVRRALLMARLAGVPLYVVHVSTRQALEALAAAREAGQAASAETCPQYLLLDESLYRQQGAVAAAAVMSPPLRQREHQAALWESLATGLVQTVATDHCPFNLGDKRLHADDDFTRIPGGTGGIELRLMLLYTFGVRTGKITLPRFVDLVATRPAKLFGLYPRKGTLRPGSDADLVVWDPRKKSTVRAEKQWQRCDHTLYEGLALCGAPRFVLRRGAVVFADGRLAAEAGSGAWLGG